MVSDSCKKRFGKIMMEEMELVAQEEIFISASLMGPSSFAVRFQFLRLILRHRRVA